ncbi:MAG: S53 family peptidase [Opitutaceae bacterium]
MMHPSTRSKLFLALAILTSIAATILIHFQPIYSKKIARPDLAQREVNQPANPIANDPSRLNKNYASISHQQPASDDVFLKSLSSEQWANVEALAAEGIVIGDFRQSKPGDDQQKIVRARSLTSVAAFATLQPAPTGKKLYEIEYAYGIDKVINKGEGQTITILIPAGSVTLESDLKVFSAAMNIPDAQVEFIYPQGKPTTSDESWAMEATLDAEWAHALAPKAKLRMVVTNSSSITALMQGLDAAIAAGSKIVSMSWGSVEWSGQMGANYDGKLNRPGVTLVAATGDSGAGCNWPSCAPYVLAIGGTQFVTDAKGVVTESVWAYGTGGTSKYYAKPTYQTTVQKAAYREVPDLAFHAVGYSIYMGSYKGGKGWLNVSGTSASAPCVAGLIARGYSQRKLALPALPHAILYANANLFFKDITLGIQKNGAADAVKAGYDTASGLGSPQAVNFVAGLAK